MPLVPDATTRFSTRVADYVRYRPTYPRAVVDHLRGAIGLRPGHVVADVGSGTGISAELFLTAGHVVHGVEPNADMRAAAEHLLAGYRGFRSVAAPAERMTLPDASVDLIVCAQAFHWFDHTACRKEFARVLRPVPLGHVLLMWNDRRRAASPFAEGYERLLYAHAIDYDSVRHSRLPHESIAGFFAPHRVRTAAFPNTQSFDFDSLRGRLLSSSYAPLPGHPSHGPMLEALQALFDRHQQGGRVTFEYDTRLYYAPLPGAGQAG